MNKFFYNIEQGLENILLNSPNEVKYAYLRGFFDTDGCVDIHGCLVLRQCKKTHFRIKRVENMLDSIDIKFKTFQRKDGFALIVYDLNEYKEKIGFESYIKRDKLDKVISFYRVKRDNICIKSKIMGLAEEPITKSELMFKLGVKYGKMSNSINRLVNEEKLKILKQRPLTIVINS